MNLLFALDVFLKKKYLETYNKIYQCWRDVWSETFLEIDKNPVLYSDAFTRQDLISAILVDGECKALCVHRYADAKMGTLAHDSYFNNWSETHLQKLLSRGPQVLVCSYLTIHQSARKQSVGIPLIEYLVGLGTEVFIQSNADVMTGAMRKNRKAHDVTYHWGATPVGIDIPSGHGDLVDLVAFFKEEVMERKAIHPVTPHLEELWNQILVIKQEIPEKSNDYKNKRLSLIRKAA